MIVLISRVNSEKSSQFIYVGKREMSDGEVIESWSLFSWNWEIKANLSLEKAGLVSQI